MHALAVTCGVMTRVCLHLRPWLRCQSTWQEDAEACTTWRPSSTRKLFGVGLPKSGTSSVQAFLWYARQPVEASHFASLCASSGPLRKAA